MGRRREYLTVRELHPDEIPALEEFYRNHPEKNLALHSVAEWEKAAQEGLFFVVGHGHEIVASTGIFPVGDTPYYEGGNTLVIRPYRGLRIQRLLIDVRAAALRVASQSPLRLLVGADPAENEVSYRNVQKAGFVRLEELPDDLLTLCSSCPKKCSLARERRCCCDFFVLPEEEQRESVRRLLGHGDRVEVRRRDGSATYGVRLELRMLRHRRVLEEFANPLRGDRP